jgi:hypothetical protein
MEKIANIIAILYVLGGILFSIGMFLTSIPTGFITLGILFFVPTVILYIEGSKEGGK